MCPGLTAEPMLSPEALVAVLSGLDLNLNLDSGVKHASTLDGADAASDLQTQTRLDGSAGAPAPAPAQRTRVSALSLQRAGVSPSDAGCAAITASRHWFAAAVNSTELTPAQKEADATIDSFSSGFLIITATGGSAAVLVLVAGFCALRRAKPPVLLQPGAKNNGLEVAAAAEEDAEEGGKGCCNWLVSCCRGLDKYDMDHP